LEDPHLIQEELDRRLAAARNVGPTKRREDALQRELERAQGSIERLLTAYQEELLSLDDLRRRMPELRKREKAIRDELSAIDLPIALHTCVWRTHSPTSSYGCAKQPKRWTFQCVNASFDSS